ncbi:uncharacterized protein LOC133884164 [Phragmites australis]|uniref:uncharacterized protein LOC133884164 n=1 Tax=Phragmites australis TaxID=29695 RepID=UPI002D77DD7E|nr:uncharacterized protein LOC133884164 [Phragmites australis]
MPCIQKTLPVLAAPITGFNRVLNAPRAVAGGEKPPVFHDNWYQSFYILGASMSAQSEPIDSGIRSPSPPCRCRVLHSPAPRRGRQRGGEVIIERVKETGGSVQYPTLTRTNYQDWSLLMRVNLQAQGLWQAVEPEEGEVVEYREDRLALAAILRAVPPEMLGSLARKRTARSAWEAVKTVRVGVQRVREANAQQLLKQFGEMSFKEGESVDEFLLRIVDLANNIRILGRDITDAEIVKKMLQVVPEHLEQIVVSIETLLDVNELSVEEVTGRLCAVEQRKKKPVSSTPTADKQGRLLLTEEEWLERLKLRDGPAVRGAGPAAGAARLGEAVAVVVAARATPEEVRLQGRPRSDQRWRTSAGIVESPGTGPGTAAVGPRSPSRPTLLMASASLYSSSPPAAVPTHSSTPPRSAVQIHEERVFAQLGPCEDRDHRRWVLDTGATNHMTGARSAFSELDGESTARSGSAMDQWWRSRGVAPSSSRARMASILDEAGSRVEIDVGILRIFDQERRLLARVRRSPSQLYVLELDLGRPVCLSVRCTEKAWRWHGRYGHLSFKSLHALAQ